MSLDDFYAGQWGDLKHKRIPIASGDEFVTLLDGIVGMRISVIRFLLSGDTQIVYELKSGITPIFDFYGSVHFGADAQSSDAGIPAFITNPGAPLMLRCSADVTANIYLQYKYIPV